MGFRFHTSVKSCLWVWPTTVQRVCVNSLVCQIEPVVPGSRAAAVELCVVRAQCVLSAAVLNSQLTWQQHPRSFSAADGSELAASMCRFFFFPCFFWRGSCGRLPKFCSLLRPGSWAGSKDENNWTETLESKWDQRMDKKGCSSQGLQKKKKKISHITLFHLWRLLPVTSEINPWDYIPAW